MWRTHSCLGAATWWRRFWTESRRSALPDLPDRKTGHPPHALRAIMPGPAGQALRWARPADRDGMRLEAAQSGQADGPAAAPLPGMSWSDCCWDKGLITQDVPIAKQVFGQGQIARSGVSAGQAERNSFGVLRWQARHCAPGAATYLGAQRPGRPARLPA